MGPSMNFTSLFILSFPFKNTNYGFILAMHVVYIHERFKLCDFDLCILMLDCDFSCI